MSAAGLVVVTVALFTAAIVLPLTLSGTIPAATMGGPGFSHRNFTFQRTGRQCQCSQYDYEEPNVRQLSNQIFAQTEPINDPRGLNALAWIYGQFIDHEITLLEHNVTDGINIDVTGDPLFTQNMTLKFSVYEYDEQGCPLPISGNTPFIDGTMVYGYDINKIEHLREGAPVLGGLRVSNNSMLPLNEYNTTWVAGDPRADEHAGLTALHTLFVREHNWWAAELHRKRPGWTSDQLFWKARQFVITELQAITYNEWLPALFGDAYATYLEPQNAFYNPSQENPLTTEFSVAAFRMGHSMVTSAIGSHQLVDIFGPGGIALLQAEGIDGILEGALTTPSQKVDDKAVNAIRNFLFGPLGIDLIALNIMRGRELRIGNYAEIQNCLFGELGAPAEDLYVKILMEDLLPGSSLPRTIAHIVGTTFRNIRDRDVDFYLWPERAKDIGSYYYNKLASTKFADIIERNTGVLALSHANRQNVFYVQ